MNIQEVAAALDGVQYRKECSRDLAQELKSAGIVMVYGASDDLMEFSGAINDELGAWEGTTAYVAPDGLVDAPECDCYAAEELFKLKRAKAMPIKAIWSPEEPECSWVFETDIPHAKFNVMEDGDLYCVGIVFYLASTQGETQ